MQKHEVATRRYGHALFDLAKAQRKIDLFLEQLGDVSTIIVGNEELRLFLDHPNITDGEKKKVIQNIFKGKIDEEIIKLVSLLIDHGRIEEIRVVYYDYKYLVYKERGIKIAYVTTAVEMNSAEIEVLKNKLRAKYESEIEVQNIVDKGIIGGVYLRMADRVIDGSIRGKLGDMKKNLIDNYNEVRV